MDIKASIVNELAHKCLVRSQALLTKGASLAVLMTMSACGSLGGSVDVDTSEIHVRARNEALSQDVEVVSNEYRDLRNRFDVLERLYVDLARHVGTQDQSVQELSTQFKDVQADPAIESGLTSARSEIAVMRNQLEAMQNRMLVVERTSNASSYETLQTLNNRGEANAAPTSAVSPVTTPAGQPQLSPQATDTAPVARQYGLHLESLRQLDQAVSSWRRVQETFPAIVEDLSPVLYRQSRGGLVILRLIVGPYQNEASANEACDIIRNTDLEQYCRVTDFEGDPLP